MDFPTDIWRAR
jgi:hypothetical protein